ncbi:MAG: recombinase family protein [Flammeovirgaceae bacterium]|nr:recombinase family protein [Flammeovirgaceae bacterium]
MATIIRMTSYLRLEIFYQLAEIQYNIYQREKDEKRRAIIYTRVSSDEQAEKGYSLQYQEEQLRKYCANRISVLLHIIKKIIPGRLLIDLSLIS